MFKKLLIVEDNKPTRKYLRDNFEKDGWNVETRESREDAFQIFEDAYHSENSFDVIISDLALKPKVDNPFETGIPLIRDVRYLDRDIPILCYTNLVPTDEGYDKIVAELLPLRASLISPRNLTNYDMIFSIFNFVRQGFVLLSSVPARSIPRIVAENHDPLTETSWKTLELLNENLSHRQIGQKLNLSTAAVRARLSTN